MGGGGTKTITQPAPTIPEYQLTPEEKELLGLQVSAMRTAMPAITRYAEEVLPLEVGRTKDIYGLTAPILRGERLPGEYGEIGAPMTGEMYAERFRRRREPVMAELNRMGLLDSGVTAELLRREGLDIALEDEARRRSEMAGLLDMAMGIPLTGLPTAQTAAETARSSIYGIGEAQRAYELAAAQARVPRIVSAWQEPNPWLAAGAGVGRFAGQLGLMAMMPYALGLR